VPAFAGKRDGKLRFQRSPPRRVLALRSVRPIRRLFELEVERGNCS
jgi:hypothetical protein